MEQRRDEELLADHLAGKSGAFDALVARYAEDLFSFFQRFVGSAAAADDLVQETFLQVHLAAGAFDPGRTFKPWLYTIAANKARDYLRSRRRHATLSLEGVSQDPERPSPGELLEAETSTAAAEVETGEKHRRVRAMIAMLPETQRMILVLGYYQRLPYAEIAEILGIPVGTVKSRLHAAVGQFAKLWLAQTKSAASEAGN